MSGVPAYVAAFEQLRPAIAVRLSEVRGSLDHAIARVTPAEAGAICDAVLHAIMTLLVTGDHALHRGFVHSFVAVRSAEGLGPDHAQRLLIAIIDVAASVVRSHQSADPTLALALNHASRLTARMVNDAIADDLLRRTAQLTAAGPVGVRP